MARVSHDKITAFAHCPDPRCPGYSQAEVQAVRDTVDHTYVDSGGDMPGVEKSQVYFDFVDESDAVCPTCSRPRELSDQRRVTYAALSGHSQAGLLNIKPPEVAV